MAPIESDCLTPFEAYMLADDTPEYPMTFLFRLRLRGELRKSEFDAALGEVVRRHPLLHATVRQRGAGQARWLIHQDRYPAALLHSLGEPLSSGSLPHIDLTREFGMRTWFATGNDQTEIWLQFHHACCDALAAIGLLDELFARYRFGAEANQGLQTMETWEQRVRNRRRYSAPVRFPRFRLPQYVGRTWRFFRHQPRRLPTVESAATDHRFPASLAQEIALPANHQPRDLHRSSTRATINDRLLAAVFEAVGQWCRRHGVHGNECLRIAVPVNLRSSTHVDPMCANCVSLVFLDRPLDATAAPEELLKSVTAEMSQIKVQKLGWTMLRALACISWCPGGMNRILDLPHCCTTTVLSNLGVVFDKSRCASAVNQVCLGDAVLDSIDFLPPIRRGVIAVLGALSYADRLSCCMHYDPRLLTAQHAIQLFGDVVDSMSRHLELDVGAVPCG